MSHWPSCRTISLSPSVALRRGSKNWAATRRVFLVTASDIPGQFSTLFLLSRGPDKLQDALLNIRHRSASGDSIRDLHAAPTLADVVRRFDEIHSRPSRLLCWGTAVACNLLPDSLRHVVSKKDPKGQLLRHFRVLSAMEMHTVLRYI